MSIRTFLSDRLYDASDIIRMIAEQIDDYKRRYE